MVTQYKNRVRAILDSLSELRYSHIQMVEQVRSAPGTYQLETEFKQDTSSWELFEHGDTWGGRDGHQWFYTEIVLPEVFHEQTAVLSLSTGSTDIWNTDNPQVIVYLDGKMAATMDMNHNQMVLSLKAKANTVYRLAYYAYSNSEKKSNFFDITVAVFHAKVEQLYYDMKVLWEAANLLQEGAVEQFQLFELLNTCASMLDLRRTDSCEFFDSVEHADAYIQENYYQKERQTSPVTVSSVGHTHIDVAWKWPLRQTRQKAVRSFLTVLNLMEEYPEYRFMSSQPQLYEFVKEDAPQLYERIKDRVREGRWETEGAMWLEADCNLISGESMIRQILYGKDFFAREFGTGDDEVLWLPDVFGYSVAMPQILKQSGIHYFMTTKIGWNEYNQIPNDTMMWRGLDGSEVLTYFITTSNYCTYPELNPNRSFSTTYNGLQNVSQVMGTWQRYQNKNINQDVLTCYGYGDGGGGPTKQMLEESRRMEVGVGCCPKTRQTSVNDFFHSLEQNLQGKKVPVWSGELYLEFHRGTYTSMAKNKKGNRSSEFLNGDAEFFNVLAAQLNSKHRYPKEKLDKVWKLLMLNQFHDILPGSSCKDVYEDSDVQYREIRTLDESMILEAQKTILEHETWSDPADKERKIAIFNPLSFSRTGLVILERENDRTGVLAGGQTTWDGSMLYLVKNMVSKGVEIRGAQWTEVEETPVIKNLEESDGRIHGFSTSYYDIKFNESGEFASIYDREPDREILKPGEAGNQLIVFEDRPQEYEAWNIDAYYEEKQWRIGDILEFKLLENGPLRGCIYMKRTFLESEIEQYIYVYHHTKRIDFKTYVSWKEQQLLLKAAFPVDVLADKAVYEVQFGNVERPTHRNTSWDKAKFEVCAHKWADLSECGYGVALMNDCKYGYDIHQSTMRLTLIKSGIFPNPDADKGLHEFTYSLYPHQGDFREGHVIQEAYDLNCPLHGVIVEGKKEAACSYLTIAAENVIADTIKQAEDGDGVIVRFYEAYGKRTETLVTISEIGSGIVEECECLEKPVGKLKLEECGVLLSLRPYEIKTIRIHPEKFT